MEINQIRFEIRDIAQKKAGPSAAEIFMYRVLLDESSMYVWSEQETVLIHALPLALIKGQCIKEIFEAFQLTDELLKRELIRLRPEAVEKRVSIRSDIFQNAYLGQGVYTGVLTKETSASMILKNFSNGGWSMMEMLPSPLLLGYVKMRIQANDLTNGQLFLLLEIVRLFRFRHSEWRNLLAPVLAGWLNEPWKYFPYHIKNALLDAARYSDGMTVEQRDELIERLNALLETEKEDLMMPTSIMEALQSLGALENDEREYETVVRAELVNIFSDEHNPINQRDAFAFHQKTFDHPYMGAYWEVLNELSESDTKKLYHMAVNGAATRDYIYGVQYALYRLGVFEDPSTADSFLPFSRLPFRKSNMPHEAIETFKLAHIIVGWLGKEVSFASNEKSDAATTALKAYGEILYWLNRRDLNIDVRMRNTDNAWRVLLDHDKAASAGVLMICNSPSHESITLFAKERDVVTDIRNRFRENFAEIYRKAIAFPKIQKQYFQWDKAAEILTNSIYGLGEVGILTDIPILKQYTDTENGEAAIKAIQRIENRFGNIPS